MLSARGVGTVCCSPSGRSRDQSIRSAIESCELVPREQSEPSRSPRRLQHARTGALPRLRLISDSDRLLLRGFRRNPDLGHCILFIHH